MLDDRTRSSLLLTERAYRDRALPGLRLARSSRRVRLFGRALLVGLTLAVVAMLLAPWIQTVAGSGSVVAFDPQGRQQVVQARIDGQIARWAEGIRENARVEEGDFVVEVKDVDPDLLVRLEEQEANSRRILEFAKTARDANLAAVEAAERVVESERDQLEALRNARDNVLESADKLVAGAGQEVGAEKDKLTAAATALEVAKADFLRQQSLYRDAKGLASQAKYQEAQNKYAKAKAEYEAQVKYVKKAQYNAESKELDRKAKEQELDGYISGAQAKIDKSLAEAAKARNSLEKAQSDMEKANKDLLDAESKRAQQQRQEVFAPRSGIITQLIADGGGSAFVKKGDPLFVLVPDDAERAVQVWLDGNDAPLVTPDRKVRLQFEGWPAVQFAGWPSVAVGTFGGVVASVDAVDDGAGRYRILVTPDPDDDPWPENRFLRQGVRANGWVLLNEVALGYEMWRRMNGFPPVLTDPPGGKGGDKAGPKPVKMGKAK